MSQQLYLINWPGDHPGTLTITSHASSLKAHQSNPDDAALYNVTRHSRQEYLAALDAAVLMDKAAAMEAAGKRGA